MNSAVEFHDSKIKSISRLDGNLHMIFDPAYVHKSFGRPGIDSGESHLQPVEMIFFNANANAVADLNDGKVWDGVIKINDEVFDNVVPLPLNVFGKVEATVTFNSGTIVSIVAEGYSCVATGESRYLERFDA